MTDCFHIIYSQSCQSSMPPTTQRLKSFSHFSARNVQYYLQIGNIQSTSSTPSGLGFITVSLFFNGNRNLLYHLKSSISLDQFYSSMALLDFRPAVAHHLMYRSFHLSFSYCALESCLSMYSFRVWP